MMWLRHATVMTAIGLAAGALGACSITGFGAAEGSSLGRLSAAVVTPNDAASQVHSVYIVVPRSRAVIQQAARRDKPAGDDAGEHLRPDDRRWKSRTAARAGQSDI